VESADLEKQERNRVNNIASFQTKLSKIRQSALFLGDITIFHEKALKSTQTKNKELKDNQKFLEEMILKERIARKKLKEAISRESTESDLLYSQAQDFILNC
jgi:benzoyl-CoA reductase/2-hydroxyglutaryl-CoA dehydratase subunit BcrC/BadD/HgdB